MTTLLDPTIIPTYGSDEAPAWDSSPQVSPTGIAQVRGVRTAPRWLCSWLWDLPFGTNADALQAYFRSLKGPETAFYFYTPTPFKTWVDVAAGTGDGIKVAFPFGGRDLQASPVPVVKVAGVAKTVNTDYVILENSAAITNLLTANQGSAETDATGFTAIDGHATLTSDATHAKHGTKSLKVACDGATATGVYVNEATVLASTVYTWKFWIYADAGAAGKQISYYLRDTRFGVVRVSVGPVALVAGWNAFTVQETTPVGVTTIGLMIQQAAAEAFNLWLECQQLGPGGSPAQWINGGTTTVDANGRATNVFLPDKTPTAGQVVTDSFMGRRFLLGRLTQDYSVEVPGYGRLHIGAQATGEEQ